MTPHNCYVISFILFVVAAVLEAVALILGEPKARTATPFLIAAGLAFYVAPAALNLTA